MTKKSCSSPFDHLDLKDGIVPLMTLLASCDTGTNINGITWPKGYITHCFNYLDLMSAMVLLTMALAAHNVDSVPPGSYIRKNSCCISFYSAVPLMMPAMSCNVITGIAWQKSHISLFLNQLDLKTKWYCWQLVLTASHDQKIHVSQCFSRYFNW